MGDAKQETISAYDAAAVEYAAETAQMPDAIRADIARFARLLGGSGRVLEIGSGGGRDAREMESLGLSVRRTDIAPGFVQLLREQGYEAEVMDPLSDDLDDPQRPGVKYDGVWAQACLMHVARQDLATVLRRLADVTKPAGLLFVSVTEGDGQRVETGRTGRRYHQTDWREPELRKVVSTSGWVVDEVWSSEGKTSPFLNLIGHRAHPH